MIIVAKKSEFTDMLEVELEMLGYKASVVSSLDGFENFGIVDLDFCADTDLKDRLRCYITYSREKKADLQRPFLIKELRELVRLRFEGVSGTGLFTSGGQFFVNGERLVLSKKEYALLSYLYEHKNTPVDEDTLKKEIFTGCTGNAVSVYIRYLREKIDQKCGKKYIYTVRNKGYMLKA